MKMRAAAAPAPASNTSDGTTRVEVDIPNETLRELDELAKNKDISRTEALVQAVATTKRLFELAPNGARITPVSSVTKLARRASNRLHN